MNADDLAKILDELGQRLGPTGEHVFQLAMRQIYIDSAIGIVIGGAALLVFVTVGAVSARYASHAYRKASDAYRDGESPGWREPDPMDYVFPLVMGGLLSAIPVGIAFTSFVDGFSKILNPEYAALRDILGAIR